MTTPGDVRGIETLLIKMRRAPDSVLMRERILALLADLPDNDEKVRLTIELADVVRKGDPLAGLRIAWMAYQYDRESVAALTGIAESLRRLGRDQKAEQVRMEIERLRAGKSKGKHGTTFELHSDDMAATRLEKSPPSRQKSSRDDMDGDEDVEDGNRDDRTVAIEIEELQRAKKAWRAEVDKKIEKDPNAFLGDTDKGGGGGEPESSDQGQESEEIELKPSRKQRGGLKLIKQKDGKVAAAATPGVAPKKSGENASGLQLDPIFATVDQLMKNGEYFAAMVEVRSTLAQNLTQQSAVKAHVRLRVIWEKLGLRGFDWKEEDGPNVMLVKSKKPLLPTWSGLMASAGRTEE